MRWGQVREGVDASSERHLEMKAHACLASSVVASVAAAVLAVEVVGLERD